jgi:hypothetical protein
LFRRDSVSEYVSRIFGVQNFSFYPPKTLYGTGGHGLKFIYIEINGKINKSGMPNYPFRCLFWRGSNRSGDFICCSIAGRRNASPNLSMSYIIILLLHYFHYNSVHSGRTQPFFNNEVTNSFLGKDSSNLQTCGVPAALFYDEHLVPCCMEPEIKSRVHGENVGVIAKERT